MANALFALAVAVFCLTTIIPSSSAAPILPPGALIMPPTPPTQEQVDALAALSIAQRDGTGVLSVEQARGDGRGVITASFRADLEADAAEAFPIPEAGVSMTASKGDDAALGKREAFTWCDAMPCYNAFAPDQTKKEKEEKEEEQEEREERERATYNVVAYVPT